MNGVVRVGVDGWRGNKDGDVGNGDEEYGNGDGGDIVVVDM